MQTIKRMKKIKKINCCWQRAKDIFLFFGMWLMSMPVLADLPTPPQKDLANSTNDWADVGGSLIFKVISYTCYALGALILLGVAAGIVKAYHTAHEKQELGHFFKMLIVGLVCAALGLGLVYGGYQILPPQH